MIVAHLIGGNEVTGFDTGKVVVNGMELKSSYQDIALICGNISLGDLDTSLSVLRSTDNVFKDYVKLVERLDHELIENYDGGAKAFVFDNFLTEEITYSSYKIDLKTQTLILTIEI